MGWNCIAGYGGPAYTTPQQTRPGEAPGIAGRELSALWRSHRSRASAACRLGSPGMPALSSALCPWRGKANQHELNLNLRVRGSAAVSIARRAKLRVEA